MTNEQFPTAQGVAATIAANAQNVLKSQQRDLIWLADQIDISAHKILEHFSNGVPAWLTLDIANVLDVDAGVLLEGARS